MGMLDQQNAFIRARHVMIMGDFNECGTSRGKGLPIKDKQFIDAWSMYHGGDGKYEQKNPGWTMPENEYFPPWRPDRIYFAFNYDYDELDELRKMKEKETGSLDSDDNEDGDAYKETLDIKSQILGFLEKKKKDKKKKKKKKNKK